MSETNPNIAAVVGRMSENREEARKLRPIWRMVAAGLAIAIAFFLYLGITVGRAINGYYFHDYTVLIGAADVAWSLLTIYLLLVAATGRLALR